MAAPTPPDTNSAASVARYLPWVTPAQVAQLQRLGEGFRDWNARINLVSRKDIDHLWTHHVLYSCIVAHYLRFAPGTRLLDLGTGGGFPGLPLAILFPACEFTLLDATAKKVRVIDDLATHCGATNTRTRWGRAEDLHRELRGTCDFVLGRAVTALPAFWQLARPFVHCRSAHAAQGFANGVLYLKGGELADELPQIRARAQVFRLHAVLPDPYFETKLLVHLSDCPLG